MNLKEVIEKENYGKTCPMDKSKKLTMFTLYIIVISSNRKEDQVLANGGSSFEAWEVSKIWDF